MKTCVYCKGQGIVDCDYCDGRGIVDADGNPISGDTDALSANNRYDALVNACKLALCHITNGRIEREAGRVFEAVHGDNFHAAMVTSIRAAIDNAREYS